MEFTTFVRKPFTVESTEVTEENIEEIALLIGKLRHKDNGQPFIRVNRRIIPNIDNVYLGFWLTRMGDDGENMRCYSRRIFNQQFVQTTPEVDDWVRYINGQTDSETHEFIEVGEELDVEDAKIASDVVQPQD